MKIVLAYEGTDGSGKTSMALFTRQLCAEHGRRFTIIGRREAASSPLVGRLTRLLHDDAAKLTPAGETLIRMAREQERAALAAACRAEVVVLDRFALSTLALARLHGQEMDSITRLVREITLRAQLHATVLVTCPFDLARERVKERNLGAILRRSRDECFLRQLAGFMEADFHRGVVTGQQWPVDNSGPLETAYEQLAHYLVPYLQRPAPAIPADVTPDPSRKLETEVPA